MLKRRTTYKTLLIENEQLKNELAEFKNKEQIKDLIDKSVQSDSSNINLIDTTRDLKNRLIEQEKKLEKYSLLVENIADVMWLMDLNTKLTFVSQSASRIFGYSMEELNNIDVKNVLTENDFKIHKEELLERIRKEKLGIITGTHTSELNHIRKNGEIFRAEIVANPIRDKNGNLIGIIGITRDISARKKNEEEIKKLSFAVEQSPASVVITDINGTIEYVNATFTKVTGYTAKEAIGKNPRILKSGKTPTETYNELWQTILSGNVWKGEFTNRNKLGLDYWEKAIIAPIKSKTGIITNFVSIKENITEKKIAELELKDSQERYKLLSDIATEGIILFDKLKIVDANKSVSVITGYSPKELMNIEILSKLFSKESLEIILKNSEQNYTFPYEANGIRKDGTIFPVEIESRKLSYKNQNLYVAVIHDLSYRKRVDQVLRASLNLNELANSKSEDEIITWGLEEAIRLSDSKIGFLHFINDDQKTISLQIWSAQTMKQCVVPEINLHYPIENAGTWVDCFYLRKPVMHNDYQNLPNKKGMPEGHFPLIRYVTIPIIEDNKVKIIFGVGNKTNDYNQFDVDVLSSFAESLWTIYQRKTFEKRLIEANSSKDKLFSIISHDLRSPIGSIQSLTEAIVENFGNFSSEELELYIKTINETSKTTYNLLDNMLIWAQAQLNKISFNPVPLPLQKVIEDVVHIFKYQAGNKDISIQVDVEMSTTVKADRNMLETIFRNLISNAIKFTPKGGNVKVQASFQIKKFVEIKIEDSGIGISKANILKIFNVNHNISTMGTNNEKGTGLGLAITKEFVDANGGQIWAESEEGKGTSFYFTLPLAE